MGMDHVQTVLIFGGQIVGECARNAGRISDGIVRKALFVVAFSVASAEQTVAPGHGDSLGHRCNYSGPGHCPPGFACVNTKCVRRCFFSGNCPEGFFCKSNFICVRKECAAGDTECCANCAEAMPSEQKKKKR
ncbi:hypothetical protein niasHT_034344 [Heterodera trifolii]|uniref:Uncharacterized protein n=1 Tax=Heterodera trifolii TaxID=157864 RepID=A0ABD2HPW7_9BILA